jgi:hypothetical protein
LFWCWYLRLLRHSPFPTIVIIATIVVTARHRRGGMKTPGRDHRGLALFIFLRCLPEFETALAYSRE